MAFNVWSAIAARVPAPTAAEVESLTVTIESARANQDVAALRKVIPKFAALLAHAGGQLGMVFGFYAYCRGLMERGAYVTWWRRWIVKAGLAVGQWGLDHYFPGRPGWNDYYMMLWFVTGRQDYLEELFRRCTDRPWPGATELVQGTYATARWMAHSVRCRHADFDAAFSLLERERGQRVELPKFSDYPEGWVETIPAVPDPLKVVEIGSVELGPVTPPARPPVEIVPLDEAFVSSVCAGSAPVEYPAFTERACAYLMMGNGGWQCAKSDAGLRAMVDQKLAAGSLRVTGDNCSGPPAFSPTSPAPAA